MYIDFFVICILIFYSFYFVKFLNLYNNKLGYCIGKKAMLFEFCIDVIAFVLIYLLCGININSIIYILTISFCVNLSFIDMKYMEISDEINCILLLIGLFSLIINLKIAYSHFLGFLVGGGIYLFISATTNGTIGGGDIKLMSCIGLIFGIKATLFIMFTSSVLSYFSLIYCVILKKHSLQKFIPFGPFICLANIIFLLYSNLGFCI